MMRNKPSSALQKTYDECYLVCSTAVYFEGQGNEAEALRSWKSALDQIYYHNAYKVPAGYVPRSETEKALKDSLRDMELQCKERVELLEALKSSREESLAGVDKEEGQSKLSKLTSKASTPRASSEGERVEKGYIGSGTIPAVNYPELSKPPPLPQRPSLLSKHSSEMAVVGRRSSSNNLYTPSSSKLSTSSSATLVPPMKKTSRSPSPDKHRSMKTTLRATSDRKSSKSPRVSSSRPVPNKAASLAWQSVSKNGRDRLGRSLDPELGDSNATLSDVGKKSSLDPRPDTLGRMRFDSKTRTMVQDTQPRSPSPTDLLTGWTTSYDSSGRANAYPMYPPEPAPGPVPAPSNPNDLIDLDPTSSSHDPSVPRSKRTPPLPQKPAKLEPLQYPTYLKEYPETSAKKNKAELELPVRRKPAEASLSSGKPTRRPVANTSSPRHRERNLDRDEARQRQRRESRKNKDDETSSQSLDEDTTSSSGKVPKPKRKLKQKEAPILADPTTPTSDDSDSPMTKVEKSAWEQKVEHLMKNLPKGVDEGAAKQIFNEIVVQGDEVHWEDVAGLEIAKKALKEAVVYPFLRPDLFMGLREPARGMLLFGPPGTGKTMLARAVATESKSTFFSISASSLTSKYLGESEKLVRALFSLAKALAPSIIFVDEIDSLLSSRSGSGEHEATRRIKTEFLIQWSDLQRAAAGREQSEKEKERGDASRVLVLAATNLPWAIDEAARRRFVRRQYIPLPEDETRAVQLRTLLGHQKHSLTEEDIHRLVELTDGFSGSDITALAKDAAMGPLRSLGEALLHMSMDEIRPIAPIDFEASLVNIRPSVSKQGLKEFEDWAREFGERGG
ncbi:ATPase [Phlyctema vagabunda]|uniref:ATPase n=1 Tax=Phlyctema vagabunda TaxID=108571 RepID=A0ABR4PSH5_9HELO